MFISPIPFVIFYKYHTDKLTNRVEHVDNINELDKFEKKER